MKNLLCNLERWFENLSGSKGTKSSAATIQPTFRRSGQRILINRIPRTYWEERGWRRSGGNYNGHYRTRYGNWQGHITVSPSRRIDVYIHNPPVVLERHPHWQCFNKHSDGWYLVHPATPVADVSAGIINLERTINEAYEL